MDRALALASSAGKECSPNPRVGCVLTDSEGSIIGEGRTQQVGGPHAEIMALRDAESRGESTQGAIAYVTLEPCSHIGRTGPCCDALIRAGISRVVASCEDPNPLVRGKGFSRLRAAGIELEIGAGARESQELNLGFFSRMQRGQPWVRLKIASSLDGTTALTNGQSQWITSTAARNDGHLWRAKADALLTGIGTVLADNPRLDVRGTHLTTQIPLGIIDSHLRTPASATLFQADRPVWIYTTSGSVSRLKPTDGKLAEIQRLPCADNSQVNLIAVLQDLARRQINELHVEAGARLNGALLKAGLVDEVLIYMAPALLGPGRRMLDIPELENLAAQAKLHFQSVTPIGPDIRIVARVA